MAMSGDLFGSPVSDLVPKSTEVCRFQEITPLRVGIQQQLDALMSKGASFRTLRVLTVSVSHHCLLDIGALVLLSITAL